MRKKLENFKLKCEYRIIRTNRGLVQDSTISPILFNIFLNDLLNSFETNNIHVLVYADDIV